MKVILKTIVVFAFLVSVSGTMSIYIIQKTALSEKTLAVTAENKKVVDSIYNEFIEIMNADFITLFSGTISKVDIENAFRKAYPQDKFKIELKELLKTISKYLRNEVSEPNHNLDLREFKKEISAFLRSRAEIEQKTEPKKLLLRYSEVLLNYPDDFPMLRLDDIEHIDEMKQNLTRLKSVFILLIVVALISLIILSFNIRTFGVGVLLTGIINAIGTLVTRSSVSALFSKNPEPAKTIAITVAEQTINSILVFSIILIAIGVTILVIKRKFSGGK